MASFNLRKRNDHIPTPEESYNALFGVTNNKGDIIKLQFESLVPYPDQPFRPYTDEKLMELVEDIKVNGVLSPIIVRPLQSESGVKKYMILSGHNRANACRLADMDIPAIVKNVDDNTAQLIMVNANLNQREKLMPSEKAFAYKMQLEITNSQGRRTDLLHNVQKDNSTENLLHNVQKVDNHERLAIRNNDSKRNIAYYVRLTYLRPELLEMVDEGDLPFRAGVELSYLDINAQQLLHEYINNRKKKISLSHAEQIKEYCKEHSLTTEFLNSLFNPVKKKATTSVKISMKKLTDLIPSNKVTDAEEYILRALEFYRINGSDFEEDGVDEEI